MLLSRADAFCASGGKAESLGVLPAGLIVAAADEPSRQVWLWDACSGALVQKLLPAHPAAVTDVRYNQPLGLLASLCERQL